MDSAAGAYSVPQLDLETLSLRQEKGKERRKENGKVGKGKGRRIIIIIIQHLYSALKSEDAETLVTLVHGRCQNGSYSFLQKMHEAEGRAVKERRWSRALPCLASPHKIPDPPLMVASHSSPGILLCSNKMTLRDLGQSFQFIVKCLLPINN